MPFKTNALARACLFACLFLSSFQVFSQKKITGRIISNADKQPLLGATVEVKGKKTATQTTADGTFVIEALVVTAAGWIGWIEGSLLIPWLLNNHWLYGEPAAYVDSIHVPEFFRISENAIDLPILPLFSGVLAIIASAYSAFRDSRARASTREKV